MPQFSKRGTVLMKMHPVSEEKETTNLGVASL